MADDILINKAATIERCVARAREEYEKGADTFATDLTRQDAAILNIQRACEAALDMGQHLIRRERLGASQSARDVFELLHRGGWVDASLLPAMKSMIGFRNIAVHEYQTLQLPTRSRSSRVIWAISLPSARRFCAGMRGSKRARESVRTGMGPMQPARGTPASPR